MTDPCIPARYVRPLPLLLPPEERGRRQQQPEREQEGRRQETHETAITAFSEDEEERSRGLWDLSLFSFTSSFLDFLHFHNGSQGFMLQL